MTNPEIKSLQKRVSRLQPPEQFSSHRLAVELREAVESLTRKLGEDFLTDSYGKNHRSDVLEAIRKAEEKDYENAIEFVRSLTGDEQIASAHLIHKLEIVPKMEGEMKTN